MPVVATQTWARLQWISGNSADRPAMRVWRQGPMRSSQIWVSGSNMVMTSTRGAMRPLGLAPSAWA